MEDVFIVSAARTPLGSMEGCLKVGSTLQDDVMMINIDDITWYWWHWWPGCDCTPAWEQSNPSFSWESWCWSRPGGGGLHGLCTSGLNSSYLVNCLSFCFIHPHSTSSSDIRRLGSDKHLLVKLLLELDSLLPPLPPLLIRSSSASCSSSSSTSPSSSSSGVRKWFEGNVFGS